MTILRHQLAGSTGRWLALAALAGHKEPPRQPAISDRPHVRLTHPEVRTIVRTVGQPSFVDSYEQTAIYAKLPGYVEKWNVDIGDRVQKGQVMATLFIPELLQEYEQKKALVIQNEALVAQANKLVEVAQANLQAARSQVAQAQAQVGTYQALVARWESEVKRLTGLVGDRVVDRQILDESQRQLQANLASRDAATAAVETAAANEVACQANLDKARVDVQVAVARLKVAEADRDRLQALVGYLTLTAPYDGEVVARNVNTGDFVLPATGDPSAAPRSADQSTTKSAPLYVVARTDVVRIYVDVPEGDANYIVSEVDKKNGSAAAVTRARVRIPSYHDAEIANRDAQGNPVPPTVTRSSWALNVKSRTLRAEIDLHNPQAQVRPGMYAYGMVEIERPAVLALPMQAITEIGNQFGCFLYQDGKAVWTQVQTGVNDGTWVELYKKLVNNHWQDFSGREQVILGALTDLTNGQEVQVIGK
jgi:multidrug efflux pump subunit AcrA (membrane-fusion protein)